MDDKDEKMSGARVSAFLRRRGWLVVVVAVVVAVLVHFGRDHRSHPDLPEYSAAPSGLELRSGGEVPFEIVLRPAGGVPTKVVAYVFAMGEGEPNAVDAKVDIAPEGSVRISGRARSLAGAREVRVVVGLADDFKRYEDALARAREGKSDGQVRVLVVPIVRLGRVVVP